MKLYWGSGSPYAWRAMLGLVFKGIEFESKLMTFSAGDHKTPEFLALNPRGKVPVLVDDDTVVSESLAILSYLDRKHPEPPLFGTTPREHATIWQLISEHESYMAQPGSRFAGPIYFGKVQEKVEQITEAAKDLHRELAGIEARLSGSPYLVGDAVSAADAVYYPSLQQLLRAGSKPEVRDLDLGFTTFDDRYPNLAAWKTRIDALPDVDSTYPPHWRS